MCCVFFRSILKTMYQHGDTADDMDQLDEVRDPPPSPPPPVDYQPNVDVGIGSGPGAGAGDFVPLVPGPPAAPAQTHVFGATPGQHPFGHQNLLSRAQAGVLRQDQLQLLQQALYVSPGTPSWLLGWVCICW